MRDHGIIFRMHLERFSRQEERPTSDSGGEGVVMEYERQSVSNSTSSVFLERLAVRCV